VIFLDKKYLEKCLTEVEKKVNKIPGTTPSHRKLFKQGYSFSELPPKKQ